MKRLTTEQRRARRQEQRQRTREYWQKRSEAYNKAMLKRGEQYVAEDIYDQYKAAMSSIEKDLALFYQRFGDNNQLTAAQAKVALNAKEMKEFRWTVNDYIKNATADMISSDFLTQLENAAIKARVTRLEAINLYVQQALEKLFGNQNDGLDKVLRDTYNEGFLHTAFEIDKGFGVATDFTQINMSKLQDIVTKPWVADGLTFSDRIWRDKAVLVGELRNELAQATIRGDDLATATKNISDRLDVSRSSAARLVMTESAYFATKAQQDCFGELGVEQVEFVATLDDRTSDICASMDGKVFDLKDAKAGDNAPPLHCWCRSCLAPYFGDKAGRSGTRAARNPETGKTEQVPADITYPEWKRKYVDVEQKEQKQSLRESGAMSGAMSGALNDDNDPTFERRQNHGDLVFEAHRNSNKEIIVDKWQESSGFNREVLNNIFSHLFLEKHQLNKGYTYFEGDYYMAQSFARLESGKALPVDILLLRHERLERFLMKRYNIPYSEAHEITCRKYDYGKAIRGLVEVDANGKVRKNMEK